MAIAILDSGRTGSSGQWVPVYADKWRALTAPWLLPEITRAMRGLIPRAAVRVAGPELGGAMLALAVSLETKLPLLVVRRAPKAYGGSYPIEGVYHPRDPVVVVEDVINTGQQALDLVQALRRLGLRCDAVVAMVDHENGARALLGEHNICLLPLFTLADLLRAAPPRLLARLGVTRPPDPDD